MEFSYLNDCQYLLSSQTNYTLTNLANHFQELSHDMINRYLSRVELTPQLIWQNVKKEIQEYGEGILIFDDTVSDKRFSKKMALVRRQ